MRARIRPKVGIAILLLPALVAATATRAPAIRAELRGRAALSLTSRDVEPHSLLASLRYTPEATATIPLRNAHDLTALASVDATARSEIVSFSDASEETDLETYRLWLRYGTPSLEVRVGRQRISFGSATFLRPLMWFDRIDPRDPLETTRGVDALLVRYYLLNNGNVWVWGLLGDDRPKGWEILPTADDTAELGGRLQWPAGNGEVAMSYHRRRADVSSLAPPPAPPLADPEAPEDRWALDGKWDVTVGLWFEAVLARPRHDRLDLPWRRFATAGADYTFGIGQGLTGLAEHLVLGTAEEAFGDGEFSDLSAFSLRYLLGVVDELRLILYHDWEADESFRFVEWRRTYDHWSWHVMAFANPEETAPSPVMPESGLLAGRGARVLLVFNH